MHTTVITEVGGKPWRFHHNGDFSGYVQVGRETWETDPVKSVYIPAAVLKEFVAEMVRKQKIAELEKATVDQLLGLSNAKACACNR